MSRRIPDTSDGEMSAYELKRELSNLEERVDELEDCVDGRDVGALYTKAMTRVLELEQENERLKKVIDAVCQECGVDPHEVLGGDEE